MRNIIALVMLFLSWPVCLINRIWNNAPERRVSWILCDETVNQDFRWYIVQNELWLSSTLVIAAFLIAESFTRDMRVMLAGLLIVSGIDIVNYWMYFRRSENLLFLEGLVMFSAMAIIFKNHVTR